jgi:uncharacterized protein (TIGR03086 family)
MDAEPAAAAVLGGVAVLERAIAYLLGSLAMVTPRMLGRPTPCHYWDLHDLLEHVQDSLTALQEAVSAGRVSCAPAVDIRGDETIVLEVRDRAVRLLGAWANTGGMAPVLVADAPVTAPLIASAGAIEVTVHGWDVAEACGRPRPIPDELADELLDLSVLLVRAPDRPGRFAPPVRVPADVSPGDRLLAYLGRQPAQ